MAAGSTSVSVYAFVRRPHSRIDQSEVANRGIAAADAHRFVVQRADLPGREKPNLRRPHYFASALIRASCSRVMRFIALQTSSSDPTGAHSGAPPSSAEVLRIDSYRTAHRTQS